MGRSLEAIDTRTILRIYAIVAGIAGFVLLSWGPMWLGVNLAEQPYGHAALIRVAGSVVIGASCCAAGLAAIEDLPSRRRSLFWFAVAHGIVWLVVLSQRLAIWGPGSGERALQIMTVVAFLLFYLWSTSEGVRPGSIIVSIFGGRQPDSTEQLRSRYEQQIRESARIEERNRLARDLHDSIKQQIFVMQTAAATAQARFESDPSGAAQAIDRIRDAAREAMAEMHAMLDQLRAEPLENSGLIEAIKKHCEALGFRTGAAVEFRHGELPPSAALPAGAQHAFLRVAQEALANIGRHARATRVTVTLEIAGELMELKIADDGIGFDPNAARSGLGIQNIRARAEEFGGAFEIVSGIGRGTSIRFAIAYAPDRTADEYRVRAIASGLALAAAALLFTVRPSAGIAVAGLLAATGLARYWNAYRRAKERK